MNKQPSPGRIVFLVGAWAFLLSGAPFLVELLA